MINEGIHASNLRHTKMKNKTITICHNVSSYSKSAGIVDDVCKSHGVASKGADKPWRFSVVVDMAIT